MTKTALTIFFILTFLALQGQDYEKFGVDTTYIPQGLKVGDTAPNFELKSTSGEVFSLEKAVKENQVVIVFYRGQWCPYCDRHLSNLNDSLSYLQKRDAIVVAIGPETNENTVKMEEKSGARFILLSDSKMNTMTDYDVIFKVTEKYQKKIKIGLQTKIEENNGQKEAKLPVPATYVIGQDGKIIYRHFDVDYRTRSSVKDILNAL